MSAFPSKMSALPPKADICGVLLDVCFVPKADIGRPSLDHPRRAGEHLRMKIEAKCLGGFEVDHELEPDGARQRMSS